MNGQMIPIIKYLPLLDNFINFHDELTLTRQDSLLITLYRIKNDFLMVPQTLPKNEKGGKIK